MDTNGPRRRARLTRFGRGIRNAIDESGHEHTSDAAQSWGVSAFTLRHWITQEEPSWLRTLRIIKRLTGFTWEEILDGKARQ